MTDQEIIDRIRDIRTRNNVPWMDIVKIALKHAPDETRGALRQILINDLAVCTEVGKLIE